MPEWFRKIAVKPCCIVHNGRRAIRQRLVEVEEYRLWHDVSLPYGTDEQPNNRITEIFSHLNAYRQLLCLLKPF